MKFKGISKFGKIFAIIMVAIMAFSFLPGESFAASGTVQVIVENTTFTEATEESNNEAPKWKGNLVDVNVTLKDDSTMMSVIVEALADHEVVGVESGYISSIDGLEEKAASSEAGWMGTINDWFVNEGFQNFTVANGKLKAGDVVRVMYSSKGLGADLGGEWGVEDKRLSDITITGGTLAPKFTSDNHEYTLTLSSGVSSVRVTPTAVNKQYQVKTFVGDTEYARTDDIPVAAGTVITVKCGDKSWASAAPNTSEAQVYTITIPGENSLLSADSLSVKTIREDGSKGVDIALTYDKESTKYTGTLSSYTHLEAYNDGGLSLTLSGLPDDASAVLNDDEGNKIVDFANGSANTSSTLISKNGSFTFYIEVSKGSTKETYALDLTKKGNPKWSKFNFIGTPSFDENISFYGQPEGTLFQVDEKGNRTENTGYSADCWNYAVYVLPKVSTFGVNNVNTFNFSDSSNYKMKINVNGSEYVAQSPTFTATVMKFRNLPISLTEEKTVIEFIVNLKSDENVELHTTVTVYVVKMLPSELIESVANLSDTDDLTYTADYQAVLNLKSVYNAYTDDEKAQVPQSTVDRLTNSVNRVEELKKRHNDGIQNWIDGVNEYAGKVTQENYSEYYDKVKDSERAYFSLSDAQRKDIKSNNLAVKNAYDAAYEIINTQSIIDGSSIGKPTEYYDDFMMGANYYNVDLGHEDTYYEMVFREIWTARPKSLYTSYYYEKGLSYTLPGILTFDIKDDSIFEIKEVEGVYNDMGLNSSGSHTAMKYYLVPKKAGTTTFTVTFTDLAGNFLGQIPEIPVHVNSADESSIEDLDDKLTNFTSVGYTTKYDNWTYEYGTEGAEFTFKVNGKNAKVYVYDYLKYNADSTAVKREYTPDKNGNVTVLLKDGYNCIEVNADYEGKNATQVYSLKGKVTEYVYENITRPGETLRIGDTAGIWIIGRPENVHKILRIYNVEQTTVFCTDMPLQSKVYATSGDSIVRHGKDYNFSVRYTTRVEAYLTASGTIKLTYGSSDYRGYGSQPDSEGTQGNTGDIANSTAYGYGRVADITLAVEADENFALTPKYKTYASNNGVVKAGEKITLSIPDLPVEEITAQYTVYKGLLCLGTTIPNMRGVSTSWSNGQDSWAFEGESTESLKTALTNITITIPKNTPAGTYRFHGGYLDLTYRTSSDAFIDKYGKFYQREIDDIEITVLKGDIEITEDLIDEIGEVTLQSEEAIKAARSSYNGLSDDEKACVDNYQTLLEAEDALNKLKAEETEKLIDKIGRVSLKSKDKITEARKSYNALTKEQQKLVENYNTLLEAEKAYDELANPNDKTQPKTGDSNDVIVYSMVLMLSVVALTGIMVYKKRKSM